MSRVLAVVAHPDDESLFMGGTLAKHVKAGDLVSVVVLSDGVGSRFSASEQIEFAAAKDRRLRHFAQACLYLGVSGKAYRLFPDQQADLVSQLALNRAVEKIVAEYHPDRVYTHFVGDLNRDHRHVGEAVLVATRSGPAVYAACPEFSDRAVIPFLFTLWAWLKGRMCVSWVWGTMREKVRAVAAYRDELRPAPHPRCLEQIKRRPWEVFVVYR